MNTAPKNCVEYAKEYLKLDMAEGYHWGVMRGVWSSVGDMAVVTMQDILGIGSEGRMNIPSTLGCNWKWRMKEGVLDKALAAKIRNYVEVYGRAAKKPAVEEKGVKEAEK